MIDLLLKDGRVVDGTGQTWFRASVAVSGDTVQLIRGDSSAVEAARVIDASSYVVCPGFIDMHSHSDLMLLTNPGHEAKLRQGVTTEAGSATRTRLGSPQCRQSDRSCRNRSCLRCCRRRVPKSLA